MSSSVFDPKKDKPSLTRFPETVDDNSGLTSCQQTGTVLLNHVRFRTRFSKSTRSRKKFGVFP